MSYSKLISTPESIKKFTSDCDGAMAPARTADGDSKVSLALALGARQIKLEQGHGAGDECLGVGVTQDELGDGGGKTRLGRITKAGDAYIRSLLVLGARAVLNAATNKTDSLSRWALALRERRGYWKAVVAIAAKNARMAWAVLSKGESFKLPA